MSSKARLCMSCGSWAEEGVWVKDADGIWWVHKQSENAHCVDDAEILDPQPLAPEVDY